MLKFISINLLSLFMSLFVILPVSAEEKPQFFYDGSLDPYSVPMLLNVSTTIEFDNSNMCLDWDMLTTAQQDAITSNIGLNNFNFAFITDNDILYLGRAIWCSSSTNGVYSLHSESNVSNNGFYIVDSNGTLSKSVELGEFSIDSIFFSQYRVGSLWFENYDIRYTDCSVVLNPITPPNVQLPTPNEPNITSNIKQSTYINTISSPASLGSVINYFRYDYFNIYAVHSSALDFSILDEQDLLIKYQIDSTGRYLIPVYDHSEVVIYGPNLTISTSGLQITPSLYSGVSYSFPNSNGIIQRDINRFDYTYVDLEMLNMYPYEDLPFSNSNTNTGKVDYLGQQLSVRSGGTGSRSIMLEFNGQNYSTTFYVVSTDSFDDIEQAKQESNQTTINNNIISNFNELDNTLQHGNSTSQNAQSGLDSSNNTLDSTINEYNQLDQQANQDLINNLNNIDVEQFELTGIAKLTNASEFVRAQFDNLTNNNPIGISIGFGLVVGLALLLLARRV